MNVPALITKQQFKTTRLKDTIQHGKQQKFTAQLIKKNSQAHSGVIYNIFVDDTCFHTGSIDKTLCDWTKNDEYVLQMAKEHTSVVMYQDVDIIVFANGDIFKQHSNESIIRLEVPVLRVVRCGETFYFLNQNCILRLSKFVDKQVIIRSAERISNIAANESYVAYSSGAEIFIFSAESNEKVLQFRPNNEKNVVSVQFLTIEQNADLNLQNGLISCGADESVVLYDFVENKPVVKQIIYVGSQIELAVSFEHYLVLSLEDHKVKFYELNDMGRSKCVYQRQNVCTAIASYGQLWFLGSEQGEVEIIVIQ